MNIIKKMISEWELTFEDYDGEDLKPGDIIELRNRSRFLVGDVNVNLGVCDDCTLFRKSDISKVSRFSN